MKEILTYNHSPASSTEGPTKRSILSKNELVSTPENSIHTLFDILLFGVKTYPASTVLFGSRETEGVVVEDKVITKTVNGIEQNETKTWKYSKLSKFEWLTYNDVLLIVSELGCGLKSLGLLRGDKVCLFASTAKEWMTMAYSCYSQAFCITTAYDNLGVGALIYSLNETEAKVLFCQVDLFKIVGGLAGKVPSLKAVVYTGKGDQSSIDDLALSTGFLIYSLDQLRAIGRANNSKFDLPVGEDLCCIMYTSGSTGNPKGVMLTHSNMVSSIGGAEKCFGDLFISGDDVYLGYLPLAHVLEFLIENYCVFKGVRIGYGSPRTLTDASVRECRGDIFELKPTLMAGVPAVWETIRKGILGKLNQATAAQQFVFNLAYKIKRALLKFGLPTYLIDQAVFKKISESTGGRLKAAVSGGAPIANGTQEFLSTVLCPIIQGYGMTESCGMMCAQGLSEFGITNSVGAPSPACEIKLAACKNYNPNPTDGTQPSGEIWVRGNNIMKGYYKQPGLTNEALTSDGWLMTGDIAQWSPSGTLQIIDRKKNLVKLSHGEYVALEKLEAQYKASQYITNMCIIADPLESMIVALILLDHKSLASIEKNTGIAHDDLKNTKLVELIAEDLLNLARLGEFTGAEILKTFTIVSDEGEWTPEGGLVTAAQKIKRKETVERYAEDVRRMYGK